MRFSGIFSVHLVYKNIISLHIGNKKSCPKGQLCLSKNYVFARKAGVFDNFFDQIHFGQKTLQSAPVCELTAMSSMSVTVSLTWQMLRMRQGCRQQSFDEENWSQRNFFDGLKARLVIGLYSYSALLIIFLRHLPPLYRIRLIMAVSTHVRQVVPHTAQ